MNLLYIANIRMPTEKAHGHQIMKMAEVFSLLGSQVTLLVPTRSNIKFDGVEAFDFYHIKKIFILKKLFIIDPAFLLKFPAGLYIKIQSLFFMASLIPYFLLIKRPDKIVYTRDEYLLPFIQFFFNRVVFEAHALPNNLNKYKKYFIRCHKIIVLTAEIKKQLVVLGLAESSILVSPDAVDLSIFDISTTKDQARQTLNLPQNISLIGYTGSFKTKGQDKGIADILQAVKLIDQSINLKFVAIGGSESDIDFYTQQARVLGVLERVIFLGPVDQSTLAIYQKAFDILLMPFPDIKHYAYYMSPLKMFEYLAAQRPIIATNLPTILEILDNNCAYLIKPGDPGALAQAVKYLLAHHEDAKALALAAYQLSKKYTWEKRAKAILDHLS